MSSSAWRPVVGHVVHRLGGPLGVRALCDGGRIGQRHHDLNVVRDDIMHLPGDPCPLSGGGKKRLLITLELQAGARSASQPIWLRSARTTTPARSDAAAIPVRKTSDLK